MATITIHRTERAYQSSLSEFMVKFQAVTFTDTFGCKINKTELFASVWDNHSFMNGNAPLDINRDTICQLLHSGNHPDIRTIHRDVPKFNEDELIRKALHSIMAQRAIVLVRDKITCVTTTEEIVKLLTDAMIKVYECHDAIDKEVEDMIAKA